jgi:hypothetical protein
MPRTARALLNALPALAISALLFFLYGEPLAAAVVGALGGLVALSGACLPALFRAFERAQAFLGRAVGLAITWVLLGAVFAVCFVPGRLVLVLRRRDPMRRKRTAPPRSAWVSRGEAFSPSRYERHY